MAKDTYNFLLTNLSVLQDYRAKDLVNGLPVNENTYFYNINGQKFDITGVFTNEAGIKAIMQELKMENDYLDYIYYVKTDSIRNKISYKGKKNDNDYTHEEYFLERIWNYCTSEGIEDPKMPPYELSDNYLPDNPSANEIINLSVTIAKFIINLKENEAKNKTLNIYVEANGGLRDFILVVIAVLRTLKLDGINIKKVMGVNYRSSNETTANEIIEKTDAYKIYDFYSGIDEFINYGRSDIIMQYFNDIPVKTKEINAIKKSINDMSDAFALCRPQQMLSTIKRLKKNIDTYDKKNHDDNYILDYFVLRIKYAYKDVFEQVSDSDIEEVYEYHLLREMIKYCLNHHLIQQALTLYSECIPNALFSEKIFYCPDDEGLQNDFNEFYKSHHYYEKGYVYIQQYIFCNPRNYEGLISYYNNHNSSYQILRKGNKIEDKCYYLDRLISAHYIDTQFYEHKDELKEIMKDYLMIKEARNLSNHASNESGNNQVRKTFKKVGLTIEFINSAINHIDNLINS